MQEEPKYLDYIDLMQPKVTPFKGQEIWNEIQKAINGTCEISQCFMPAGGGELPRLISNSLRFNLSEDLANAMKGVEVAFKSATKAISGFGKLKICINADTSKFRQAMHKWKQRIAFKKTLQKLPTKLRCKLRNSIWRNK